MIPAEAVEAAAREIDAPSEPAAREIARRALEAAAPHMRQAFFLEMNLRAVQDELSTPIYPLGKIEDKRRHGND